jgi:glycogen debranching enzyme
MAEPWTFAGEAAPWTTSGGVISLVQGPTFCISGRGGDVRPGMAHGLFFRDRRLLHRWELLARGLDLEPLAAHLDTPFSATLVQRSRPTPGRADSRLLVIRRRHVGRGMREDLDLRNYGPEPLGLALELVAGADFAGLFEVKEGRQVEREAPRRGYSQHGFELALADGSGGVRVAVHPGEAAVTIGDGPDGAVTALFDVTLAPHGRWRACLEIAAVMDGRAIPIAHPCGEPIEDAVPVLRLAEWRRRTPVVHSDHDGLERAVARTVDDLGALRFFDPRHPERPVVAAGAPWFMTLFGRDSLLTSWMALPLQPDLCAGVLGALADLQGYEEDPASEEQPGRILHEVRPAWGKALTATEVYYGSADATPLFVMVLGELARWGADPALIDALLPHADRALAWIDRYGDADGDGYVEYARMTPLGLLHQGWKDSHDGINFADGRDAAPPIALCEIQAYVYGAYLARADLAERAGDVGLASAYRDRAGRLKAAFNRDFWVESAGWFAVGLDADKAPIDALASNMGHALWTGIVDAERAPLVAAKLVGRELFSGWGVRTLGTTMGAYNPISYHNGSVWPHDTALCMAGLMRYGFVAEAHQLALGLLAAAEFTGWRLPELFAGVDRDDLGEPVPYPTACSPQAWASGAPLLILRALLRLDPDVPRGRVWLAPELPDAIGGVTVERMPLGGAAVTIEAGRDGVGIRGLPAGLAVELAPRPLP